MSTTNTLRWGILGTGHIAEALAKAINECDTGTLVGVGSRTDEAANRLGGHYSIRNRHDTYEGLLADNEVDTIYIALPNHLHAEWAIKCAQAGKHILCEKPLATNLPQAMAVIEAMRRYDVFMMEAFMYRCHPQTARLQQLIREGAIGEVRLIQANFSYNMGPKYDNIRLQNESAGGGIMDVGCYTASMTRMIAGAALGADSSSPKDVAEPIEVKGCANIGDRSRVDEQATASFKFDGGIVANLACGCEVGVESVVRVWGSEGNIVVPNPWFPGKDGNKILVKAVGKEEIKEILIVAPASVYAVEADTVAAHIANRQAPSPCMTWEDSLGNMRTLDRWRESVGLKFDQEKCEAHIPTVSHLPLAPRPDHRMKYLSIPGFDHPISQLVMGTMVCHTERLPLTCALLDHFVELGGNALDLAWVYGGGKSEESVGRWLQMRGNREGIILSVKGAHTPMSTPEGIEQHIADSLQRLQVNCIDLWMMHRDNLDIPVGEFIDCLNAQKTLGNIRAFGVSNWTVARIEAANRYAASQGVEGLIASSCNLSLAVLNEEIWEGSLSVSDSESRAWHERTQFPLFCWSSQAQGFFTGRYSQDDLSNSEMVRCWYNKGNFQRLERARELAEKKGVTATQIAVAYVLNQPFPCFALVGPHTLEEMRTTTQSLDVALTPEEMRWVNLE